jgi:hypothetical protein
MTFLTPYFLWIGLGVSAAVAALHFIVTRQPQSEPFPTARFVPDIAIEAVSRAREPSDLLVLVLRLLAVMSLATAFSGPIVSPKRASTTRIILADLSKGSANISAIRDSAAKFFRPTDLLIGYDSLPRPLLAPDSIPTVQHRADIGRLSAALVSAIREGTRISERADSISLIAISAFPAESWDAATDTIRSLWPGAIQVVSVAPSLSPDNSHVAKATPQLSAEDPLAYALALAAKQPHADQLRIVREGSDPSAAGATAGVTLYWPSAQRPLLAKQSSTKMHGALRTADAVVVAPFPTRWEFPSDSVQGLSVIARWEDGSPAAVQRNDGSRCERSTNIPVPAKGDLVIRPEFVSVVQRLISSCVAPITFSHAGEAALSRLKGGTAAAARASFRPSQSRRSPYTLWLLVAAIVFLILEQFTRRSTPDRRRDSTVSDRIAA